MFLKHVKLYMSLLSKVNISLDIVSIDFIIFLSVFDLGFKTLQQLQFAGKLNPARFYILLLDVWEYVRVAQ